MPNKKLHPLPEGITIRKYNAGKYEVFHGSRQLKSMSVKYDAHKWAFENAETESMWRYFIEKLKPTGSKNGRSKAHIAQWHDDSNRIHPAPEISRFGIPGEIEIQPHKVSA